MFEKNIRLIDVTESTNALLSAEAETGIAKEGYVIRTEHQTAGRGRLERDWESPPGKSILFSALLYPNIELSKLSVIGLMISMVILDAVSAFFKNQSANGGLPENCLRLKWPNDIMVNNKKLCGILCESGTDPRGKRYVVIGAGLNVNQDKNDFSPEIRNFATSLKLLTGIPQNRDQLFSLIISKLGLYYNKVKSSGTNWIISDWIKKSGIIGKSLTVKQQTHEIRGICVGLGTNGALQLKMQSGEIVSVYSGDSSAN